MALAAPISLNDAEGVHLLLEAGADPNRYADDADPLSPVIYAAIRSGCSAELTGLLLGPDERRREWRTRIPRQGNHTRAGLRAELLALIISQDGRPVT